MKTIHKIGKRLYPYRSISVHAVLLFTAFALTLIGLSYIRFEIPDLSLIIILLHGFAPLIGLVILHIFLVIVHILFIDNVEEAFEKEDETFSRESAKRKIWQIIKNDTPSFNPSYLSLKEHSPPYAFHFH